MVSSEWNRIQESLKGVEQDHQVQLLIQTFGSTDRKAIRALCLLELRKFRSELVINFYRKCLTDPEQHRGHQESFLINIDLADLASQVGFEAIERFCNDDLWVVRIRALAILFQFGRADRSIFLEECKRARIEDIDEERTRRYVAYLKRRTLRVRGRLSERAELTQVNN